MEKIGVNAFIITGTDPHASEYLPERWKTRAFISGFNGSFGSVVVTNTEAGLWTDTRYFLQAENELLGSGIKLHKLRVPEAVSMEDWLAAMLAPGSVVGIDPQTISLAGFRMLESILAKKKITIRQTDDLLDKIWENRAALPENPVFDFPVQFSGSGRAEKQKRLAGALAKNNADLHVVTMLDELAWLFNLRGSDVNYNPVFTGFGLAGESEMILFADQKKIPQTLKEQLQHEGIDLKEYTSFPMYLEQVQNRKIYIDSSTVNYSIYNLPFEKNTFVEGTSLVAHLKSVKNETELAGFRKTMIRDGVALIKFIYWLKNNVGKIRITEFEVGKKLAELRSEQENFVGESFTPIVGYKAHGAMVHLSVNEENAFEIESDGILLFDSGGQYLDGTTDITRTVAIGSVTEQQKRDFTIVLKGMIGLTLGEFPYGTKGCHLDILARKAMWENGMNYGHGTGHGIGHFLNVHEGPMAIRQEYNENLIVPGMVLSNEPAFYREGLYGLRTENMMVCVEKQVTEFGRFLAFETLSVCPIDTTLIVKELLDEKELSWLNNYHKNVNQLLKPVLTTDLHDFLDEQTQEI
jgi:Xaa-Pro aminopeptidase